VSSLLFEFKNVLDKGYSLLGTIVLDTDSIIKSSITLEGESLLEKFFTLEGSYYIHAHIRNEVAWPEESKKLLNLLI
jgi:hypothetical protein